MFPIAKAFEFSRRRENVSFNHHRVEKAKKTKRPIQAKQPASSE
jgi:hypothetical protein